MDLIGEYMIALLDLIGLINHVSLRPCLERSPDAARAGAARGAARPRAFSLFAAQPHPR